MKTIIPSGADHYRLKYLHTEKCCFAFDEKTLWVYVNGEQVKALAKEGCTEDGWKTFSAEIQAEYGTPVPPDMRFFSA